VWRVADGPSEAGEGSWKGASLAGSDGRERPIRHVIHVRFHAGFAVLQRTADFLKKVFDIPKKEH